MKLEDFYFPYSANLNILDEYVFINLKKISRDFSKREKNPPVCTYFRSSMVI